MSLRRAVAVASLLLASTSCDPIPYTNLELTPRPAESTVSRDSIATIAARVLLLRGFAADSASCLAGGQGYRRVVIDSSSTPPRGIEVRACVLPDPRSTSVRFVESRFGPVLLPSSTDIVREVADSLRGVATVRISSRR